MNNIERGTIVHEVALASQSSYVPILEAVFLHDCEAKSLCRVYLMEGLPGFCVSAEERAGPA
jgi:hypothetical protein